MKQLILIEKNTGSNIPEFDETDYVEDEYITDKNDPYSVEKVTDEKDYDIPKEEIIQHEKIEASPYTTIGNLPNHDFHREKAVLHSLRKGEFRK